VFDELFTNHIPDHRIQSGFTDRFSAHRTSKWITCEDQKGWSCYAKGLSLSSERMNNFWAAARRREPQPSPHPVFIRILLLDRFIPISVVSGCHLEVHFRLLGKRSRMKVPENYFHWCCWWRGFMPIWTASSRDFSRLHKYSDKSAKIFFWIDSAVRSPDTWWIECVPIWRRDQYQGI
jgi:hypothetical protein